MEDTYPRLDRLTRPMTVAARILIVKLRRDQLGGRES